MSGQESAEMHVSKQRIWLMVLEQLYFQYCAFWQKSFGALTGRGQKGHNGFKFGTFIGRFPSDGAASVAVKGLTPSLPRCHLKTANESAKFESL